MILIIKHIEKKWNDIINSEKNKSYFYHPHPLQHVPYDSERFLEVGVVGELLAEPRKSANYLCKNSAGQGLLFELCMLLVYQTHHSHTYITGDVMSYLYTTGYITQIKRATRCGAYRKGLHGKCEYVLSVQHILGTFLKN